MAAEQFKFVVFQAGSIPQILEHLQKQPISDIDGMLLSQAGLSDLPRQPEHEVDIDIGQSWAVLRSPKTSGWQGDLRAYELWPHIFPLTGDHMKSTMLDASK